ncbi:MAG: peptidase M4 [Magnetococcales bacterium]|nr:peptidase M4 [Magnetococcales bacterium]
MPRRPGPWRGPPSQWLILVACSLMVIGPGMAAADDHHHHPHPRDHDLARRMVHSGAILPLERLLEHHPSLRTGRLLEIELKQKHEKYIYEIEALDEHGQVMKLSMDAQTGQLLQRRKDD